MTTAPLIVGLGGTLNESSTTMKAIACVLKAAEAQGARTILISGQGLNLPLYDFANKDRGPEASAMIEALSKADGIVLGSPGYHGTISGVVKNALDYAEDIRADARPYFSGRAVGCVATAGGWQAAVHTLAVLRDIVHALRGWPTPMGVAINTSEAPFAKDGSCADPKIAGMLDMMADEILSFAKIRAAA